MAQVTKTIYLKDILSYSFGYGDISGNEKKENIRWRRYKNSTYMVWRYYSNSCPSDFRVYFLLPPALMGKSITMHLELNRYSDYTAGDDEKLKIFKLTQAITDCENVTSPSVITNNDYFSNFLSSIDYQELVVTNKICEKVIEYNANGYDIHFTGSSNNSSNEGKIYINKDNSYFSYIEANPVISQLEITGTSIDSNVTCSWVGEDIAAWKVQAKLNGSVVAIQTGTSGTSCTFPAGTFNKSGSYTFELTATNDTSVTTTATTNLSWTQATISLLEIPGSTVNVDEPFTISWVSSNQTSFSLTVGDKTYTGTTQKSVTIPSNAVGKGTINVALTVNYANQYYSNSATTSNSFVGYGKPSAPTLNISSSYSSATPSLAWSSNEQTAYRVVIKQTLTTVEDSGDKVSNNKYYIPTTALSNNTTYTVSVKVKNKYNLWSDEATASFMIQFTVPTVPTIQAISDITTGSIIVTVSTTITNDTEYKNTEIWKRETGGEWKRMAYKLNANDVWQDFYVAGGIDYEYKARNIGKSGGISESSIITAQTVVNGYNFYDVENNNNYMRFTTGEAPKPKINQPNIVQNLFANASAPTTFGDGTLYWSCTMQFSLNDREETYKLFKLLQAKLLLYKDNKGHKWFGNIINSPEFSEDDVEIITVSLEFTQAQFEEEDVFCDDNLELIIWNGGWKFDGSHVFGGE